MLLYKYMSVDNTTLYIYTNIFYQGDMFRPYKVILRPSKKTDPRVVCVSLHCGIQNAYKFLYLYFTLS